MADISERMFVPFHNDGVISQFEGYETLRELDWEHYRTQYGNIQRLDLILEGENDSANRFGISVRIRDNPAKHCVLHQAFRPVEEVLA